MSWRAIEIYLAQLCFTKVAGNITFLGGWVVEDYKNKANSAKLSLAGAWAELGKTRIALGELQPILQTVYSIGI